MSRLHGIRDNDAEGFLGPTPSAIERLLAGAGFRIERLLSRKAARLFIPTNG